MYYIFQSFLMLMEESRLRVLKSIWTQVCAANILIISSYDQLSIVSFY